MTVVLRLSVVHGVGAEPEGVLRERRIMPRTGQNLSSGLCGTFFSRPSLFSGQVGVFLSAIFEGRLQ